jgi:hypothetical protein
LREYATRFRRHRARLRPASRGFPDSLFDRLSAFGIGKRGQSVVDLVPQVQRP